MSLATEAQELAVSSGQAVNARVLKSRAGFVTPLESAYGAVGDGATDDTAALVLAAAAAVSLGFWLDGLGKTYGVSELSLPVGLKMRNARFKELDPQGSASRKTVKCTGTGAASESLTLEDVYIDRNGNGTGGSLNSAAGIRISSVARVHLTRVEVTGNNKGSGIAVLGALGGLIDSPYVHDIRYVHTVEDDDVIQGLWIANSNDLTVLNPRIANFGRTDLTSVDRDQYNRGIAMGGCKRVKILGGSISRVEQAIDVSGSGGNEGCVIQGVTFSHLLSVGVKLANTAVGNVVSGNYIEHAGLTGILASGPDQPVYGNPTRDNLISNNVIRNCGTDQRRALAGGEVWGVSLFRQGGTAALAQYPKAITVRDNLIISDQGVSTFTAAGAVLTPATMIPISTGVRCRLTTTGTLPAGLALATDYFLVAVLDSLTFKLASSHPNAVDGTVITTTTAGTGTHTVTLYSDMDYGAGNDIDSAGYLDVTSPNEFWGNTIRGAKTAAYNTYVRRFEARVTGANMVIADSTLTPMVYNNALSDPYSLVTLATGVILWPRDGEVSADTGAFFTSFSANEGRYVVERWDGAAWAAVFTIYFGHGTNNVSVGRRYRDRVVAGDQWRLSVYQSTGGNLTLGGVSATFRYEDRD